MAMRVPALANLRDQAGQAVDLVVVDAVGRLGHVGAGADLAGEGGEGDVVAREAGAAIAHRALQVLRADAGVGAQRLGHGVDVGARHAVADVGQHVGVGDLGGDVGVHRDLGQLGVHEVHALHRRLLLAHLQIDGLQHVAGLGVALADQDRVGEQHVAHDAAERDEFRIVAEAEVGADLAAGGGLEGGLDLGAGRAGHHRAGDDDHVVALLVLAGPCRASPSPGARSGWRRSRCCPTASARSRSWRRSSGSPRWRPWSPTRRSRLAAISSLSCGSTIGILPAFMRVDERLVHVEADDAEAAAGEHCGERGTELAETDDRDARQSC